MSDSIEITENIESKLSEDDKPINVMGENKEKNISEAFDKELSDTIIPIQEKKTLNKNLSSSNISSSNGKERKIGPFRAVPEKDKMKDKVASILKKYWGSIREEVKPHRDYEKKLYTLIIIGILLSCGILGVSIYYLFNLIIKIDFIISLIISVLISVILMILSTIYGILKLIPFLLYKRYKHIIKKDFADIVSISTFIEVVLNEPLRAHYWWWLQHEMCLFHVKHTSDDDTEYEEKLKKYRRVSKCTELPKMDKLEEKLKGYNFSTGELKTALIFILPKLSWHELDPNASFINLIPSVEKSV